MTSEESAQSFGGPWTQDKLRILGEYLALYTTALKQQGFVLHYVDAFAGSGAVDTRADLEGRELLSGSPPLALRITDKPFDHLVFIDSDALNAESLQRLIVDRAETRRAESVHADANDYIPWFCSQLKPFDRAVVFLDPFGTQVEWPTVEAIARSRKCDALILVPVSTVRRLLPRKGVVRSLGNEARLASVFGDDSWRRLQRPAQQQRLDLFGDGPDLETASGIDEIVEAYMTRLRIVFAGVAPNPKVLRNSNNAALYVLMFAASNPRGASLAIRLADHILTRW